MMRSSFLKATATMVATMAVLAAGADSIPTPATPTFEGSREANDDDTAANVFLWVAANVIIVWLVYSSRRRGGSREANDDDTAAAHGGGGGEVVVVPGAVDDGSFVYASESYEANFSDAHAPVSKRLQAREATAARRSDRPRVRKTKPEPAAGHGQDAAPTTTTPWATTAVGQQAQEETETAAAPAVAAAADDDDGGEGGDVSMDSLWASIVQRRAARPVVVRKSESWGNEELPRLQRVAETAAARRQQVRKSASAVAKAAAAAAADTMPPAPAPAAREVGWRTRDVLVAISPDELLRRAESFIRRQREQLRLQRQESEQRLQMLLQRRLHGHGPAPPAPLIRAS